jgi:hypothetical protein
MSEYQYYEFLAVDRTLTPKGIEAVREFFSRAEITATRFQNEYNWGNFRGNVKEFLTRFYDLHLYRRWANVRRIASRTASRFLPRSSARKRSTK